MRRSLSVVVLLTAASLSSHCGRSTPAPGQSAQHSELRTIDTIDPKPTVLNPPPTLPDEGPALSAKVIAAQADNPAPLTEHDEQVRAQLPFVPAIGMDPVDGSKISIRATTPTLELKGRIYYFSSEETKQAFSANPAEFMKGSFSHL